ncbi:hypothetical protein SAMN05216349_1011, partial [Oribacterium sp. KHPX15]
ESRSRKGKWSHMYHDDHEAGDDTQELDIKISGTVPYAMIAIWI